MPRGPSVTYRQAVLAIRDAHMTVVSVAAMEGVPQSAQEVLRLLAERLLRVLERHDNRRG